MLSPLSCICARELTRALLAAGLHHHPSQMGSRRQGPGVSGAVSDGNRAGRWHGLRAVDELLSIGWLEELVDDRSCDLLSPWKRACTGEGVVSWLAWTRWAVVRGPVP